ncbi:unnamed protein product [Ectocarpus fasciculatus]
MRDPVPSSAAVAAATALPAGKSRNSLGKLNAVEERKFKRQRPAGSDATLLLSAGLSEKFHRAPSV